MAGGTHTTDVCGTDEETQYRTDEGRGRGEEDDNTLTTGDDG